MLWTGKSSTGFGAAVRPSRDRSTVVGRLVGNNGVAVTATIEVYGTNDGRVVGDPTKAALVLLGTLSLSGTGAGAAEVDAAADSAGFAIDAPWMYLIGKLTAITGAGASTDLIGRA